MQTFAAIGTGMVQEIAQMWQKPLLGRKLSVLHPTENRNLASEI